MVGVTTRRKSLQKYAKHIFAVIISVLLLPADNLYEDGWRDDEV
jgi:hypothetical protein